MKIIIYSTKDFERPFLEQANRSGHHVTYVNESLSLETAERAKDHDAVVVFPGDDVSAPVIAGLHQLGVRYIAIRAVGYDNVDLQATHQSGITCANVPEYSPYAIAEHAVAMLLCLNRKLVLAHQQVHRHNFTVGKLVGFDLNGKTAGIIGTGKIGRVLARILHGFGCRLLAYDIAPDNSLTEKYQVQYVGLNELCAASDIISLNTPLNASTRYLINKTNIELMKPGVILINTARGAVVNTVDVIEGLQSGKIGALGMDVYENEKGLFFFDKSEEEMKDTLLETLLQFSNVLITPHQAFATREALSNIADTTFYNIDCWDQNRLSGNELQP